MADPWLKFYPSDWRQDPALKMCSMAARGLWIEMLCLMHQAVPYGHLLVNGQSPTDAQLAVLVGAPSDQITDLLGELEAAGIFSRTRKGVIYSRKLTRMAKKAATARNNGSRGGNPSLGKAKGNPASDNPKDKGQDKPQKPEARSQREDTDVSSKGDLVSKFQGFDEFWAIWPHKVSKQDARTAWGKLSYDEKRAAYGAVIGGWFDDWQARNPSASGLHPATFLNKRRWEDQPANVLPFNGGQNDRSSNSSAASHADASSQRIAFAGAARRTPSEDCF